MPDIVALTEFLRPLIGLQIAAFEQAHLQRRTGERARQRYACGPGADDAKIGFDDSVGGYRTSIDEHETGD